MNHKSYTGRNALVMGLASTLLIVLSLAVTRPLIQGSAQRSSAPARAKEKDQARGKGKDQPREQAKEESSKPVTAPTPGPRTEANVSRSPAALELGGKIDRAIDESAFASARWGIYVSSLRDGRVIYARDAQKPITPASNMKVYTTAVALDLLGADYRWRTSVYAATAPDKDGAIHGDIILYGRGAPDLASEAKHGRTDSLAKLADDLFNRGVRRVRGAVYGDESYLRGEALGDGWLWNDVQWYFGAEVSALTINGNETSLTVTPGAKAGDAVGVKFDVATDYFQIRNDANTLERGTPTTIGITRGLSDNEFRIWGQFPAGGRGFSARLSAHRPALWAAKLFRDALRARGIAVEGEAHMRDARAEIDARFDPQSAVELASIQSKTLGEIARSTNKESINLNAELILRTLGKERGEMAPDPDPQRMRVRGDDEAGTAVIRFWLARAGISTDGLSLHDGSGLSRLDLVTPEVTARLLAAIAGTPSARVFRDSLPVAGRDGTLRGRLGGAAGRIQAKTGTLTYTNSLSGYIQTGEGEPLVFSIFCNNETEEGSSTRVIDEIARLLASYHE
ncbi:MAG TPA: D-alanyl-D-alanine carboxypeptidase/D-alanyl-D-alanine-endopeptidase [Pyrinomonadaceae bacterium]|jgi:D-alanyl-D-alanine carboxypeptidase/D-alanyl-D-alanine-endopeptidase (penicillin-binding protein 4)